MTNRLTQTLLLITLALGPALNAPAQDDEPRGPRPPRDGDHPRQRDHAPDRPQRGDNDRQRPSFEPIAPENVGEALDTLRQLHGENQPNWMKDLQALAEEDPAAAARKISRFPRIHEMIDARKNRPEEFKVFVRQSVLMREVFPLLKQYREASRDQDEQKMQSLRPQIRERVGGLFEVRIALKRLEIRRIQEQLKQAEQDLAQIENNSEKLIDAKLTEMLEHGDRRPRQDDADSDRPRRGRPDAPKGEEHGGEEQPAEDGLDL